MMATFFMARRVQVHNNCIFFFQTRHERVQWPSGANLEEAENNATSRRLLLQPFLAAWIKVTKDLTDRLSVINF